MATATSDTVTAAAALTHLWAKSPAGARRDGERLTTHLRRTVRSATMLAERTGPLPVDDPERFWWHAFVAALLHDTGKLAVGFQLMVGNLAFARYGDLGARWGVRHELLSLAHVHRVVDTLGDALADVAAAVLCHHRALHSRGQHTDAIYERVGDPAHLAANHIADMVHRQVRRSDDTAVTNWLASELDVPVTDDDTAFSRRVLEVYQRVLDRWRGPTGADPDAGLRMALLQGAVVAADRIASAHTPFHTRPALHDDQFAAAGIETPRAHQHAAAETSGHLTLVAPTGTGKTEAALAWAARQQRELPGAAPRVWYTLPYLSSIDSMATRLERHTPDGADAIGLVHSKARQRLFDRAMTACDQNDPDPGAAQRAATAAANATRLHQHTLRVGTPHQLVLATLAGPRHAGELLDAANSVLIFDEIHAYDPRRFGWFLAIARLWERLGGRVAAASATMPTAARDLLADTLTGPLHHVRASSDLTAGLRRHHLRVDDRDLPTTADELVPRWLNDRRTVLVVANTVRDAQHLYEQLAPLARARVHHAGGDPDTAVMLLHSRFRHLDRHHKETRLAAGWPTGYQLRDVRGPALVIATQTVEVSLDVSFDALLTAAAPLDALLQRAGRVNRVAELAAGPAPVTVATGHSTKPYDEDAVAATIDALTHVHGADVDEQQIGDLLDTVHDSPWGQRWHHEVTAARDEFAATFTDFTDPLADRSHLEDVFREQFTGAEAIHIDDLPGFTDAWERAPLSAASYAIPIPNWALNISTDVSLRDGTSLRRGTGYAAIDRPYQPDTGLDLTAPCDDTRSGPADTIL